ncbi:MAG: SufD family Fe-S cluster assembly protein [Gemmataceae bacterium]|nr:SufD family Fe-S cluster assembly protein [Gemmataceae bacterium]
MTSVVEKGERLTAEASAALGRELGESARLRALRATAAAAASQLAMPTPMERPWKYLDISRLDLDGYQPGIGATRRETPAETRLRYGLREGLAGALVASNGGTVFTESVPGVTLTDFSEADGSALAAIQEHLGTAVPADRNKLTALHYAFLRGGVLVQTKANAEPKAPVRIVRDFENAGQLGAPHTLILAGANSCLDVIEDCRSGEGDVVVLPVVEIFPGPGARVRYTVLHRWGSATRVFGEQRTVTERDSALVGLSLVAGGRVVKSHIESSLVGRGSSSELLALTAGRGREHADFYTLQDHIGPDTRSDLLFKAALRDASRSVYYGLTRVGLGAKNADANQENRNLLLSRAAKADSDPVLEILTHDIIRASHGATAGPVDEEQLFYLETRGLPRAVAEALLVEGFLGQVLDRVPDEALRAELDDALEARLRAG